MGFGCVFHFIGVMDMDIEVYTCGYVVHFMCLLMFLWLWFIVNNVMHEERGFFRHVLIWFQTGSLIPDGYGLQNNLLTKLCLIHLPQLQILTHEIRKSTCLLLRECSVYVCARAARKTFQPREMMDILRPPGVNNSSSSPIGARKPFNQDHRRAFPGCS